MDESVALEPQQAIPVLRHRVFDSAKIPRFTLQLAGQVTEVMHPVGDQVVHVAISFQYAIHSEHRGRQDFGALFFKQAWPDDGVDEASFIFQGQEDGAAGGHRSLAHRDQAAGAHAAAVWAFVQFPRGDGSSAPQDRA